MARGEISTQTRQGPGAPCTLDGRGPALSTWVAEECSRVLRRELTRGEERVRANLVGRATERELGVLEQFKVPPPAKIGAQTEDVVDTRRVSTWKEGDGKKTTAVRPVAKGYQDPDLRDGNADIAGCVSGMCQRISRDVQLIYSGALRDGRFTAWISKMHSFMRMDSVAKYCYSLQENGIPEIFAVFGTRGNRRMAFMMPRLLFFGPCRSISVNSVGSPSRVGLEFAASSFDPCLLFVYRGLDGWGVSGAIATHFDDISGRGEP